MSKAAENGTPTAIRILRPKKRPKIKVEDKPTKLNKAMIEQITEIGRLQAAFSKVRKNKGSGGIDKISIGQYEKHLAQNLAELSREIKELSYQPLAVRRVYIPKANKKQRPLGIPAVRDRVVQQALLEVIEPEFEPLFSDCSYGFRPGRSAIQAIKKVQAYLDEGYEYIVEADIKDFFTQLNHQRLMSFLKQEIRDGEVRRLIWKFLKAGVMEEGVIKKEVSGTPQGGVISPLLANIYLNSFDQRIERSDLKLVRYADDFVILCKSVNQAVKAMKQTRELMESLGLELNEDKTRIVEYWQGFEFLGYRFQKYYGNHKWPRDKAIEVLKTKVKYLTRRCQPRNVKMVIEKLNPVLRGWGNYFRHGNGKKKFQELDSWIRMRLRSFIEKKKWPAGMNWKYPSDHFVCLGLVSLTKMLDKVPVITGYQPQLNLSFSITEQPHRKAVCGKSARTV